MFKTIGKLFGKKSEPAAPAMTPDEQKAFELGREISRNQLAKVDQYIAVRFEQIRFGYLNVIQKQFDSCRQQDEHSPLLVARIEYSLYLEHVTEAHEQLLAEVKHHFHEWTELNKEMQVEDAVDKYLDQSLTDKFTALRLEGLKVMTDNADILKTADDNWRRRFPELAAAQPLD
ncbi:hypothetical protein ABIA16_003575 [Sinorhizobium fredii]